MTVYVNETLTLPYPGMIVQRNPVNISIIAGNDAITLILYDSKGASYSFSIDAGQKLQQKNFDLFRFEIQGSGQAAIAVSYPETVDPSIQVSLNPDIPQSVTSPQLPKNLDSNGNFLIRHLSDLDIPSRSWFLGSSDVPNRGWTLGSSDTPSRSWTLGTGDTPGRSWELGVNDTPSRSWVLAGSDNPDVSVNQTNNFKTDIGQANTYLKDTKIPYTMNQDSNGTIGINMSSNPSTKSFSFTGANGYTISPPTGYRWKLRSIVLKWTAAATQSDYPQCQIYPSSLSPFYGLNVFFASLSVTANDSYIVDAAEYVQNRSNEFIQLAYVTEFTVNHDFYIYPTETLSVLIGEENASVNGTISYAQERIT